MLSVNYMSIEKKYFFKSLHFPGTDFRSPQHLVQKLQKLGWYFGLGFAGSSPGQIPCEAWGEWPALGSSLCFGDARGCGMTLSALPVQPSVFTAVSPGLVQGLAQRTCSRKACPMTEPVVRGNDPFGDFAAHRQGASHSLPSL